MRNGFDTSSGWMGLGKIRLAMPLPIFILTRVVVRNLSANKFAFWDRQNLFHRITELLGWLLDLVNGGRHYVPYTLRCASRNFNVFVFYIATRKWQFLMLPRRNAPLCLGDSLAAAEWPEQQKQ